MKKLLTKLKEIYMKLAVGLGKKIGGTDKAHHFFISFAISFVAACVCFWMGFGVNKSLFIGILTGVIVAALKELFWDWLLKKGTPEYQDFVSSVCGSFAGAGLPCVYMADFVEL